METDPLQLSTDKEFRMFPRLEKEDGDIEGKRNVKRVLSDSVFSDFHNINILPLIYDEKSQRCNILVFDYRRAESETVRILREMEGRGRKTRFFGFTVRKMIIFAKCVTETQPPMLCERGLWTHTKKGLEYFDSITNGWIDYSHNDVLVALFSHALVASRSGHIKAIEKIKEDIVKLKKSSGMKLR